MPSISEKLKKILGKESVLEAKEDLFCYAYDASMKPEKIILPAIVALPESTEDVQKVVKFARENSLSIVPRCAGTNLCGGCIVRQDSIVIHFSRMNKILEINPKNLTVKVQPGVVLGDLQDKVRESGLFFPPDPSNLQVSTVGGAIALSSGGPRTFKYGTAKDYVLNLEVVDSNGNVFKTGADTAKNVTGYNLTQLFAGSEGTLGLITEATLRLIPAPEEQKLIVAYFNSIHEAVNTVDAVINALLTPCALDILDQNTLATIERFYPCGLLTDKAAALFMEIDGFACEITQQQEKIRSICEQCGAAQVVIPNSKEEEQRLWTARRSSFASVAKLKPHVATEDVVVPRSKTADLIEEIQKISQKYNLIACIMGHAGDGNIHPNFALDLNDEDEAKRFSAAKDELFEAAIRFGGTLSGEHGIGCEKSKYISKAVHPLALEYMKKIKILLDPENIFNPEKIFYDE